MSGLICGGNVYIARFVNGVAGGEHGPINCKKFAYSPGTAEVKERKSRQRDTYGQALSAVTLPGTPEISIEFDDADPEVLQYALMGTLTDVAVNSGSATDEEVIAHLDLWSKLANRGVSSVVVKDETEVTTYVNGTDYTLDATAGMVKALSTGAINDGDELHISYSYGALAGNKIVAGTETEIQAQIRLDGVNLDNQKKVDILVWEAKLTTNGEIDPMSEDFVTTGLKGILVTPSGKSGPLEYRELD